MCLRYGYCFAQFASASTDCARALATDGGCRTNPSRNNHGAGAQMGLGRAEAATGLQIALWPIRTEARFLKKPEIDAHGFAGSLCDSLDEERVTHRKRYRPSGTALAHPQFAGIGLPRRTRLSGLSP
jgi:hypothetical protein